ncbi:MAG: hypothetical protein ACR2KZ_07230 [Segetibacter sp.]
MRLNELNGAHPFFSDRVQARLQEVQKETTEQPERELQTNESPPFFSTDPDFLNSLGDEGVKDKRIKPFEGKLSAEEMKVLRKPGYRAWPFLVALEFLGGDIIAKSPYRLLADQMKKSGIDISSFWDVSNRLERRGYIIKEQIGKDKRIRLTEAGIDYIAKIKAHPELVNSFGPAANKIPFLARDMLELIVENSQYVDENEVHWLKPRNHQEGVLNFLADESGRSYEATARQVSRMKTVKKYFETRRQGNGSGPTATITNIGVTPAGLAYLQQINQKIKSQKVFSDEEFEDAVSMAETAIELAEETHAEKLIQELQEKCVEQRVAAFDRVTFEEHIFWLEETIEKLRQDYLFKFSGR